MDGPVGRVSADRRLHRYPWRKLFSRRACSRRARGMVRGCGRGRGPLLRSPKRDDGAVLLPRDHGTRRRTVRQRQRRGTSTSFCCRAVTSIRPSRRRDRRTRSRAGSFVTICMPPPTPTARCTSPTSPRAVESGSVTSAQTARSAFQVERVEHSLGDYVCSRARRRSTRTRAWSAARVREVVLREADGESSRRIGVPE